MGSADSGECEAEGRHSGWVRIIHEVSKERIPPFRLAFRSTADPHGSRNVGYRNVALRAGILVQQSLEAIKLLQKFSAACLAVPVILLFGLKLER
jgi:hypothetical protein